MVQKEIPNSKGVQLVPILVASGGGGGGSRDGLPGSSFYGQLPGTMVREVDGRTASISQGGEGGKTIGFTDDDMILTLGSSSEASKIAGNGACWHGGNGAFNAGGGGGGIYGGGGGELRRCFC